MNDASATPYVEPIRSASRHLVRELGFLQGTLAGTAMPPSAVHALIEIGARTDVTARALSNILTLEKSSVSRLVRKLIDTGEVMEGSGTQDGRTKPLSLTVKGQATLAGIDAFASHQIVGAFSRIHRDQHKTVIDGIKMYANALQADRSGEEVEQAIVKVEPGYRTGAIARCTEMHARYYAQVAQFDRSFEAQVAGGLASFCQRLDKSRNQLWLAAHDDRIVGTVAIDGEDLGPDIAHLRWFIVSPEMRGKGIGRQLLNSAIDFCTQQDFTECHLWTFKGLDAARHLYERHGFNMVDERPGTQWGKQVIEQKLARKL